MTQPSTASNTVARYPFFSRLARVLNSGQSRSVLIHGNVHDLFFVPAAAASGPSPAATGHNAPGHYAPLAAFLADRCSVPGIITITYELNGPIRFRLPADAAIARAAFVAWRLAEDPDNLALAAVADRAVQKRREAAGEEFDAKLLDAIGKPSVAFEFLRQLALCSRSNTPSGRPYLAPDLLIIIEAADMALPAGNGDVAQLNPADRQRVAIVQDWFSDPGFMRGRDSVIMIAESVSLVHPRVAKLPSVVAIEAPAPDQDARRAAIDFFLAGHDGIDPPAAPAPRIAEGPTSRALPVQLWGSVDDLAALTAGLSIHALRQLLVMAAHAQEPLTPDHVVAQVESFILSQLGEDVVEFKKPEHSLDHVVGFTRLKAFLKEELIPRFRAGKDEALPGAAVAGPIGGGKTFIFEAVAAALGLPVLTLKNIRSQWFGQTDVIFERLRRTLLALGKVVIFVDEADTQFGGVGEGAHETERRLTGKIQQMMSDPMLRGKVIWLLMTARIHLLSPDIRRPGRVGDLIIPVLDPEGEDREAFLRWTLRGLAPGEIDPAAIARLAALTEGYSAAAFASLRSRLKAAAAIEGSPPNLERIEAIVRDQISPAIGATRRYQTLQALVNCTRRSLLPDPEVSDEQRERWNAEIRLLESRGIR